MGKVHGGYLERQKRLRAKIGELGGFLDQSKLDLEVSRLALVAEEAEIASRSEGLREEVAFVAKREREAQEEYRVRKEELDELDELHRE